MEKGGRGSLVAGAVHVLLYERAGLQGKVKKREMFREEQGYEGGILAVFGCPPPVCFCDETPQAPTGISPLQQPEHERAKTRLTYFKENTFLFDES